MENVNNTQVSRKLSRQYTIKDNLKLYVSFLVGVALFIGYFIVAIFLEKFMQSTNTPITLIIVNMVIRYGYLILAVIYLLKNHGKKRIIIQFTNNKIRIAKYLPMWYKVDTLLSMIKIARNKIGYEWVDYDTVISVEKDWKDVVTFNLRNNNGELYALKSSLHFLEDSDESEVVEILKEQGIEVKF